MGIRVIVGSENDMYLGRALVEVDWSRGSRASTVVAHREGMWHAKGRSADSDGWRGTVAIAKYFEKDWQR